MGKDENRKTDRQTDRVTSTPVEAFLRDGLITTPDYCVEPKTLLVPDTNIYSILY